MNAFLTHLCLMVSPYTVPVAEAPAGKLLRWGKNNRLAKGVSGTKFLNCKNYTIRGRRGTREAHIPYGSTWFESHFPIQISANVPPGKHRMVYEVREGFGGRSGLVAAADPPWLLQASAE